MKKKILPILLTLTFCLGAILTGCGNKTTQVIIPPALMEILASDAETYLKELPQDIFYLEEENGAAAINEEGNVYFTVTQQQKKNWVEEQRQFVEDAKRSAESIDYTLDVSEDFQTITFNFRASALEDENPMMNSLINYFAGHVLLGQLFQNPDKPLELTVIVKNQETGEVVSTTVWPDHSDYVVWEDTASVEKQP